MFHDVDSDVLQPIGSEQFDFVWIHNDKVNHNVNGFVDIVKKLSRWVLREESDELE